MAVISYQQIFEETTKAAYSHGFEAIYALETVDPKSVRRLTSTQIIPQIEKLNDNKISTKSEKTQFELDLGPEYRDWIKPFLAREPIQVLNLSRHAERSLLENSKYTLQDLAKVNLHDFVFFKGMGQGHIDEIQLKLRQYLDGRSLYSTQAVDYISWLRTVVSSLEKKKTYVSLQAYQLTDYFSLSPSETVEVARLPIDKREEWTREMMQLLQTEARKKTIDADMKTVTNVFIKPWMQKRLGIATEAEITERIQRTSSKSELAYPVLNFFSALYYKSSFPIGHYLYQVDKNVYCADSHTAQHYNHVSNIASSYFYKPEISYNLAQLVSFIERELASQWQGFQPGFIEKVLRQSSRFRVRKGAEGLLVIKLS